MGFLYDTARDIKNAIPVVREVFDVVRRLSIVLARRLRGTSYAGRVAAETSNYAEVVNVHDLPPIFHYWSNTHLRPMLESFGFSNPDQLFAKHLRESALRRGVTAPVFLSIGAGNCDTEVRVARLLREAGLDDFRIECLDLNASMLERGRHLAEREGVGRHITGIRADFNAWRSSRQYDGVMANQSLHHVVNLEGLFDEIRRCLAPGACFVVDDMIGRNGHQRWPEALSEVQRFWRELPREYRYNRQLKRYERTFRNWDCSTESFEGIRSQDILPLLIDRFDFDLFIAFGNVIDIFVDRSFGHNFNADAAWDRDFIDRVQACDEQGLSDGSLTPTHMMAVLMAETECRRVYARGLSPAMSVRR